MKRLTVVVGESGWLLRRHFCTLVPDAADAHLGSTLYRDDGRLVACLYPETGRHPAEHARAALAHLSCPLAERYVIGTHSEAIIGWLGEMVHDGKCRHDEIEIHVVREDGVSVAGYDADGALRDWPFGFFAAVEGM